jgi:radical SAM superfamily enzyme YgiQ (UPF0313 family)
MFSYKNPKWTLDIVFPNKMHGGVYSLGPLIVYNLVNNRKNWYCERVFIDNGKITAPLVGFTLQWELDLEKAVSMNPKLVGEHFDFVLLGDVEETLPKVLDEYEKGKETFLENITKIKGVYVKSKNKPKQHLCKDLESAPYPLVQPFPKEISKDFVFGKCFILELERSCPYSCKFCPLPTFYNKFQYRSLEKLKEIIDAGLRINNVNKIIIYAPSFVHPKRKEILQYLVNKGVEFSVPSIKAEHMDKELLELVKKGGQISVTIAPELGERLRFKTGKKIKDKQYFDFIERCNHVGFRKIKMYMLLGIPGMSNQDLEGWVSFVKECNDKFNGKIYLSVNYFVPKPTTPYADYKFDRKEMKKQAVYIKKELKGWKIKLPSLSTSYREWQIAKQ